MIEAQMTEFHVLLDSLIALNKMRREAYEDRAYGISLALWLRSYATVSCNIGRQAGYTSYILSRALPSDVYIVPGVREKQRVEKKPCAGFVVTATEVELLNGRTFKTIYVENPSLFFTLVRPAEFYARIARDKRQTIVLLGE